MEADPYAAEAKERWGHTDAYRRSATRTATYTKANWQQIAGESDAINEALLALMADGDRPSSEPAMDLAEQHRAHISKWFYHCSLQMHAALGDLYVADPRFSENIDRVGPGLAAYLSEAISANAARGQPPII